MRMIRGALPSLGVLAIIVGIVWIGQGTGWFPYPRNSFMIDQTPWAWRGAAVLVAGVIMIVVARRWR